MLPHRERNRIFVCQHEQFFAEFIYARWTRVFCLKLDIFKKHYEDYFPIRRQRMTSRGILETIWNILEWLYRCIRDDDHLRLNHSWSDCLK